MTTTLPAAALLAPVPEVHLREGERVCAASGRVAFGSRAWETLSRFDGEVDVGAPVLIYASHPTLNRGPVVSWRAWWAGWTQTDGRPHPLGDLLRPPSAVVGGEDLTSHWVGFWEVTDLHELDKADWIKVSSLFDSHGKRYKASFVPEGPIILGATP